jgi:hypothetical protein
VHRWKRRFNGSINCTRVTGQADQGIGA